MIQYGRIPWCTAAARADASGAKAAEEMRERIRARYERMPEQEWFRKAHEGRSCGPEVPIEDGE